MSTWSSMHEKRREPRHKVSLPATLRMFRDEMAVRLLDISNGGAMARAEAPPPRGEEVLLVRGALEVVATVAWVKESDFGLSFHRAINRNALISPPLAA